MTSKRTWGKMSLKNTNQMNVDIQIRFDFSKSNGIKLQNLTSPANVQSY